MDKPIIDNIVILDLDGVLITTPPWKRDARHEDGYSDFNPICVNKLNEILEETGYDIVLSSTRRIWVDIDQMNLYFENRGILKSIISYIPLYDVVSRKEEIELFLTEYEPNNYIIIDDDKSLSDLSEEIKSKWIQTEFLIGLK